MCHSKSRLLVMMWGKSFLILHVAILWQGLASGASTVRVEGENDLSVSLGTKGGANIVLDPDKDSVLATLEHLQNENDLLRQDLQQSQARMMALVKGLREENSQLKQQQENNMAMALEMIMGMGKEISGHLQTMKQQVHTQVSGVISSVGEVRSQQEMVTEMVSEMTGFVDQAHNVTSQLTRIRGRLMSVEADVLMLHMQDKDYAKQLTAVQQRMNDLEFLLQGGQATGTPPTKPSATPSTTPFVGLTSTNDRSWTEGVTSRGTNTPSPTSATTASPRPFTIPPNYNLDTMITSILVTKAGALILGDLHANRLTMSRIDTPNDVVDIYNIHRPWAMLELEDGTIIVTREHQDQDRIAVLRITSDGLGLVKYIHTERSYGAIAQGPGNTLIVSDRRGEVSSARIDIIDMDGVVQRTLLHDVDFLIDPYCLKRFGDDVYVSDWTSSRVFRVNVYTGEVKFTIGDLDLSNQGFEEPRQFDIDGQGNLYIATGGVACIHRSFCIIRVTQTGSWQEMGEFVPRNGGKYPYGLELTSSQIIVSWNDWDGEWYSEVSSYPLPQVQEESTPGEAVTTTTTSSSHETGGSTTESSPPSPSSQSTTSASREEELSGSGSGDAEDAEYSGYVSDDNWFLL